MNGERSIMKLILNSKSFWVGFSIGVSISLVVNFFDIVLKFDRLCFDCSKDFGLPFSFYQSGTFVQPTKVIWAGLLGDIFVLAFVSICIGFVTHALWNQKVTDKLR